MSEQHAPGPVDDASWARWEAALVETLLALRDEQAVLVEADPAHGRLARAGTSRLRRALGAQRRVLAPSATLVRVEDHLRGHWVGAERTGGQFPWSAEEVDAILDLGWHRPTLGDGKDFVRFWPDDVPQGPYLPLQDARRAAAVVASTFREVLGAGPALPAVHPADD